MAENLASRTQRAMNFYDLSQSFAYFIDLSKTDPDRDARTSLEDFIAFTRGDSVYTAGSVFFAGATGEISEDNANLFYDDTLNRLGILTDTPQHVLDVDGEVNMSELFLNGFKFAHQPEADLTSAYVGYLSGNSQTGVSRNNTGFGFQALRDLNTGRHNVAIGINAAVVATIAEDIVAIGRQALQTMDGATQTANTAVGSLSGFNLDSGARNTFLGHVTGTLITSGDNNIMIGSGAGNLSSGSRSNSLAVGRSAKVREDNQAVFGSVESRLNNWFLGQGIASAINLLNEFTMQSTSRETNANLSNTYHFNIAAGQGTGTGEGSHLRFKTAPSGTAGTTQNALVECARFDVNTSAGETRFLLYDNDSGTLKRVSLGAADSGGVGFKVLRITN